MAIPGGGPQGTRESFYDAQRRHRRAGWRFSVLSAAAVFLLGLPLSLIVSPFLVGAGLIAIDIVNLAVPMPDPVADIGRVVERLSDGGDGGEADRDADDREPVSVSVGEAAAVGAVLVAPGMVAMGATWVCVRRVFLRAGAGAVVLAAGARPPRPGDVEERQLVNLVEEMALAAGVPPPRVMVLDTPVANVAVAGSSVDDATLVVPRGLLDDLGRAPTGAVVGDMLAVVVNGDLRAALVIASVYSTFDMVGAVLAAPYSRATRRTLGRAFRLAVQPRSRRGDGIEEHFIAAELTQLALLGGLDDDSANAGCLKLGLQLPFLVASIAYTLTRMLAGSLFVTPVMAAWWRRRRLLADATAVELTRDPDALARALERLQDRGGTVPAGPWTHLFAVGPEVARERTQRRFEQRRDDIWDEGRRPGESRTGSFARRSREAIAASTDYQRDLAGSSVSDGSARSDADGSAELATFLPPLSVRLERLAAMGAHVEQRSGTSRRPRPRRPLLTAAGWVVGVVLLAIIVVLFLLLFACVAALIYLALLFELLLVAPVVILVHALVR